MKKIIFNILLLIILFPFCTFAQGTATNPALPPPGTASDGTVPSPTPPVPSGTSAAGTPAPVGTSATPIPPRLTPKIAPKTVVQTLSPAPMAIDTIPDVPPISTSSADSQNIIVTALLASGAAGLLFFVLNARKKKPENKKNDQRCANIKKLMEDKLNELTDVKGQLTDLMKNRAIEQIKDVTAGTSEGKLLAFIEDRKNEYDKLKELYEKCITDLARAKKVLIFHGTEGYPEENWFPWLKGVLETKGAQTFIPQFPSPPAVAAKIPEWFDVLKDYEKNIDENTILVGHSLGGVLTLRILEKLNRPVQAAFFVGTPIGIRPILNYDRDNSFGGFDFDWDKIKKNAKHFVVFHSDNDPYVSLENGKELAKNLGVELSFIPNAGHFNKKAGYTKFEKLWEKLEPLLAK